VVFFVPLILGYIGVGTWNVFIKRFSSIGQTPPPPQAKGIKETL
jgi:hypothetical protein